MSSDTKKMAFFPTPTSTHEVNPAIGALTTRDAATLMGISVTSVQKLVDRGDLEAWVTSGGHRRIARASIQRLLGSSSLLQQHESPLTTRATKILLAEDDSTQVRFFQTILTRCSHPIELIVATDASTALIQLERGRPDLVVTDLLMKPFDGFHLINVMQTEPVYYALDAIVLSCLTREEAEARGRIPDWVAYYQKPVNPDRILGYLDSMRTRVFKRDATNLPGEPAA
jgi:excisionase family DNA binding protein